MQNPAFQKPLQRQQLTPLQHPTANQMNTQMQALITAHQQISETQAPS